MHIKYNNTRHSRKGLRIYYRENFTCGITKAQRGNFQIRAQADEKRKEKIRGYKKNSDLIERFITGRKMRFLFMAKGM